MMAIKIFVTFEVTDILEKQDQRNIKDVEAPVSDSHPSVCCSALLAQQRYLAFQSTTTTQTQSPDSRQLCGKLKLLWTH